MENIIKKAIEGGWQPFGTIKLYGKKIGAQEVIVNYYHQPTYLFDCKFWQALGKACGWDKTKIWLNPYTPKGRYIPSMNVDRWIQEAMNFHEINLTEGFEKAVEYLEQIIK